jgi:hypothetical protein
MSKRETKAQLYIRINQLENDIKTLIFSDAILDVLNVKMTYQTKFEIDELEEKFNITDEKPVGNGILTLIHLNQETTQANKQKEIDACESCQQYGESNCLVHQ